MPTQTPLASRPNIGVYTNPEHNLRVGPAGPTATDEPGPDEVILHIRATGICASDIHFWKHGRVGDTMVVRDEHILGHESSADVIKVGANVRNVAVGDRVAVEPGMQCLVCDRCTHGCYNGCPDVQFKSTPPYDGLLRRFVAHPARLCHKIGNMSYELGALLEPVSVALAALEQASLRVGDATVICGAGPIGIMSAILARAAGAAPIVITDLNPDRLRLAREVVPHVRTLEVSTQKTPQQVAEQIVELAGLRPTMCIECTGFESSIQAGLYSLDFRGTLEIVGVGKDTFELPFMHASVNEITIRGLFRYANTWPRGIRMINDGIIDPSPLVTHKYKLEDAVDAFNKFIEPGSGAVKVMIFDDE